MADEGNRILVVDDSPQVCKALGDVLKASGYVVRTAPSGERAMQIIETDRFDLVITDLKMSGMSGMDLAKQIFARLPGIPVVILTGFGDMDAVISALRSGVADFLKKPFSIDEVLSVVKRELVKSQARSGPVATTNRSEPGEKPPRVYIFNRRDLEQIETVLSKLRAQASAESALLVEQAGYVIAAKGTVTSADLESISTLIAGTRSSSASLASLLGETQEFSTSYMEGQRVSVYTTALGRGLYLVVIVPKGTKQGLVWLYAKEAAVEIDKTVQRATAAMQQQLGRSVNAADAEVLHQEMAAQKVENVFEAKPASARPAVPRPNASPREVAAPRPSVRPLGTVSTYSFKKDRPAEVVQTPAPPDKSAAGTPLDEAAPKLATPPSGPPISFDEALKLGLVGFEAPAALIEETVIEPATGALTPEVFDAALKNGLLDFEAAPPTEEPVETDSTSTTLTPASFEEALKHGLFNFDDDSSAA